MIRHTDDQIEAIVLRCAFEGAVTNTTVRERTGLDRQAALAALQRLVDRGQLIQLGERRGTRYELPGWRRDVVNSRPRCSRWG